jgi:hypothetical protein
MHPLVTTPFYLNAAVDALLPTHPKFHHRAQHRGSNHAVRALHHWQSGSTITVDLSKTFQTD